MPPPHVATPKQIARLAAKLTGLRWSWSRVELDGMLAELGWTVTHAGEYLVSLATGADSADGPASAHVYDGTVTQLEFPLCAGVPESPEGTAVRQDLLATATGVVNGIAGPRSDGRPGEQPEVRWGVPSGVLRVVDNGVYVEMSLFSAEAAERLDEDEYA